MTPAELAAHMRDNDPNTGHGYDEWDQELWARVYGDLTMADVHARDHGKIPGLFGHTHDEEGAGT